jgi:hypothetical protein
MALGGYYILSVFDQSYLVYLHHVSSQTHLESIQISKRNHHSILSAPYASFYSQQQCLRDQVTPSYEDVIIIRRYWEQYCLATFSRMC